MICVSRAQSRGSLKTRMASIFRLLHRSDAWERSLGEMRRFLIGRPWGL